VTAIGLVALGASWGGLHAVETVLGALPRDFGVPIVIAQHRQVDANNDGMLVRLLDARCALTVCEADDKQALDPGVVLVAPPDYHLLVELGTVALSVDAPLNYSRPSIDILFSSAADAYANRLTGVILTGSNSDGALGLAQVAERGGTAIVQDPETAERREMPDAALWATPEARVLALAEIGPALARLAATGVESGS
jgi:two-component system chemotaxis response regulator CheB